VKKAGKWRNGWTFYRDVPCHASLTVQLFLVKKQILSLPHPQSYPDLTFCNFLLFLRLKIGLRSHFASAEEIQQEVTAGVTPISEGVFPVCFQEWQYCWCKYLCGKEKYIDSG
jgi:hypothetical protein